MSTNANPTTLNIEGYTNEQALFAFSELQNGASPLTIQILLYRKFALYDQQADDLIAKVQQKTGIKPVVHNLTAEIEAYHTQKFMEKGINKETASQMAKEEAEKIKPATSSNSSSRNTLLGLVHFLGGSVAFGLKGHVTAIIIAVLGLIVMIIGLSQTNSKN